MSEGNGESSVIPNGSLEETLLDDLDTLEEEISEPVESITELRNRCDAAVSVAQQAVQLANEAKADQAEALEKQSQRIQDLEKEIDVLQDDRELISQMGKAIANNRQARALTILRSLYHDARDSPNDRARMTAREAWNTVQRAVARTRMNDHLRHVEKIVEDTDVCYYVERPRGKEPPSHLVLDLSSGQLPTRICGTRIKTTNQNDV